MSDGAIERKTERDVGREEPTRRGVQYRPVVDILETEDELRVVADMPGARPGDIDINFDSGVLTIHGRVQERQPEGTQYVLREYGVGDFFRAFEVSENIDAERISADYSDGVLVLHLPKAERARARRIEVKSG